MDPHFERDLLLTRRQFFGDVSRLQIAVFQQRLEPGKQSAHRCHAGAIRFCAIRVGSIRVGRANSALSQCGQTVHDRAQGGECPR